MLYLDNELILTKQQNKQKSRQQPDFVAPEDQIILNQLIENCGLLKVSNYANKQPNDATTNDYSTSAKRSKYESDDDLLFDSHDGGFLDFLPGPDDLFNQNFDLDFDNIDFSSSDFVCNLFHFFFVRKFVIILLF